MARAHRAGVCADGQAGNDADGRDSIGDVARGGSVQGEIDALNKLIELAIPPGPFIYEGIGTYVIPGHGRVCEQLDVVDYRDMVVIVRDVIQDMINRGMTLAQIKEASPADSRDSWSRSSASSMTLVFSRASANESEKSLKLFFLARAST